ncbi:LamG domain-containing protein [Sphingobacterium sp. SGG-5]|uniref:LamG domain-containing protein n=1 Tax=Sphingobacterium sp. SGG-5 TaxID=2710881 RepID=UPI0013EBFC8D|nr:LamG domain-containing protein [Sphingobacterium sp. SGG-5]NGM63580.1 LamG domain-containing protein [Sphingobacterium sp. SGG-5]
MKKLKYIFSAICLFLFVMGCDRYDVPDATYTNEVEYAPTRIHGSSQHAAFPSLVRFNNAFYVAFREGPAHGGAGGKVRIMKSTDGEDWQTVQLLELVPPVVIPPDYLAFNGVNQAMMIDHHTDFDYDATGSFSVSGWIMQENTSRGAFTQFVSNRSGGNGFDFALQENRIKVDAANPYLRTEQAQQDALVPGEWNHIGFTFDGTGKRIRIYQNGVEVGYTTTATFHPQTLVNGQANDYGNKIAVFAKTSNKGTGPAGGYTKGAIKTLRFWNKALSAGEMGADMNAAVTASTPNLIAAYDFSQKEQVGSDIVVPDIKNSHPGKLRNFTLDDSGPQSTDLRDPKLTITPDNRIMILMDGEFYNGNTIVSRRPYVSYSDANGANFSEVAESDVHYPTDNGLSNDNFWIWSPAWNDGVCYGVDYIGSKLALFKSTDAGQSFRTHKLLDRTLLGNPSETALAFDSNDKMYAFIRRNGPGNTLETSKAYLASSAAPYTSWIYSELDYRLEGQNVLMLDDQTFCIGTRRFDEDNQNPQMAVFITDLAGNKQKEIILQSSGDCSYPGMVIHDGYLWVVYYSSHEGVSSIYSSKIPVADLVAD